MNAMQQSLARDLGLVEVTRYVSSPLKRRELVETDSAAGEDAYELCLNLKGNGFLNHAGLRVRLEPGQLAVYQPTGQTQLWRRADGGAHEWLSLRFSGEFLRSQLEGMRFDLRQDFRGALFGEYGAAPLCFAKPIEVKAASLVDQLLKPSSHRAADRLKIRGICLELASTCIFREEGQAESESKFCEFYQRQTSAKVERARRLIEQQFREPFSLDALAKRVGSSPSHLSRSFTKQTGSSITQFLRLVRLRHARKLLLSGRCNVTEAALAAGFNHLSHFAKSFQEEFGVKPSALIRPSRTA